MQPLLAPAPVSNQQDVAAEQTLREHLLAQVQASQAESSLNAASSSNIDPAIAGSPMALTEQNLAALASLPPQMHKPDGSSKKGAKRELSTSKRAQQNRAAQRAFRLRKESYIKNLEGRVHEFDMIKEAAAALEAENYSLRNYIISLQSSLLEGQRDIPAPPHNIDLTQPRSSVLTGTSSAQSLQQSAASAAQAVAEMAAAAITNDERPDSEEFSDGKGATLG